MTRIKPKVTDVLIRENAVRKSRECKPRSAGRQRVAQGVSPGETVRNSSPGGATQSGMRESPANPMRLPKAQSQASKKSESLTTFHRDRSRIGRSPSSPWAGLHYRHRHNPTVSVPDYHCL